jgi:hypothetical protein
MLGWESMRRFPALMTDRFDRHIALCAAMIADGLSL